MTAVLPYDRATGKPIVISDAKNRFANSKLRPPTVANLSKLAIYIARHQSGMPTAGLCARRLQLDRLPSIEDYAKLMKLLQSYDKSLERNMSANVIKQLGDRAWRRLQTINSALSPERTTGPHELADYSRLRYTTPDDRYLVKPNEYYAELTAICRHFECYWDKDKECLEVWTEPITIIHPVVKSLRYNFGRMIIPIKDAKPGIVKPHCPRWAEGRRDAYFHPHCQAGNVVNGAVLCFGEGGNAAARATQTGRLFDRIDMMISILRTYGSNPYAPIEKWNGICDERFDPATGRVLAVHETVPDHVREVVTCPMCAVKHDNPVSCYQQGCTVRNVCIGCVIRCQYDGCNNFICDDHIYECSECGRQMCSEHFGQDDDVCDACFAE